MGLRSPDFWSQFRNTNENNRSLLYRYEYNGILVYDSKARLSDQEGGTSVLEPRVPVVVKDDHLPDYDKYQYLHLKAYPPTKPHISEYTLVVPQSNILKFDSHFESGNLRKAIKVNDNDYNLLLEYDVETEGHTQWYYFSVKNYKANHTVRFNIVNLMKYESLYNNGMRPLVYSSKTQEWMRAGFSISYYQNNYTRNIPQTATKVPKFYYTLTFSYTFLEEDDTVFFAHCYPFTYSELRKQLDQYTMNHTNLIRVNNLCSTLAGNPCPIVTITQNVDMCEPWEQEREKLEKSAAGRRILRLREAKQRSMEKTRSQKPLRKNTKKYVILTARVHPGESNASYMMKGALDFLLSDKREAKILRKNFVFKIIPMLNPDGVRYGNYRCSLLGVDLNRRWKHPSPLLHPTIYYTKKLIQSISEDNEVLLYCDMHGHSMKKNVFMYACSYTDRSVRSNLYIKLLPYLMQASTPLFSFRDTHFRVEKFKESTARVVAFKEFDIAASYTLEASFYGPSQGIEIGQDAHMDTEQLESIGKVLLKQLLIYLNPVLFAKKFNELVNFIHKPRSPVLCEDNYESIDQALNEIDEKKLVDFSEEEDEEGSSGGSDSCASDNDDRKLNYLYKHRKKRRHKRTELVKASQLKSKPICECKRHPTPTKTFIGRRATVSKERFISGKKTAKKSVLNFSNIYKFAADTPTNDGPIFKPFVPIVRVSHTSGGFRKVSQVKTENSYKYSDYRPKEISNQFASRYALTDDFITLEKRRRSEYVPYRKGTRSGRVTADPSIGRNL